MNRLVLIGVELVDGKPDLQLPANVSIQKEDDRRFVAAWDGHHLTLFKLGRIDGTLYFLGVGDKRILVGLAHLGASVRLAKNLSAAVKGKILAAGIKPIRRVSDGQVVGIHPPVVWAGDDAFAVGLDDEFDANEEYIDS